MKPQKNQRSWISQNMQQNNGMFQNKKPEAYPRPSKHIYGYSKSKVPSTNFNSR